MRGTVRAGTVVRATEGYTRTLRGEERTLVPVYSLMIATEPLPDPFWDRAGLAGGRPSPTTATWSSTASAPRTAGWPSAGGGRPTTSARPSGPEYDRDDGVHEALRRTLVDLFPALAEVEITHRWGGPLGIARDWFSSVGHRPATGVAWAGGYVGDGVSTTNLAGRTLRDLILGTTPS